MVQLPKISQADLVNPNPLTILQRIRQLILGKEAPDALTKFFFFLNLLIWSTFFFWSLAAYYSLSFVNKLAAHKQLMLVIDSRAAHLGIPDLLQHYKSFMFYSIFIWLFMLFGLILLWRKRNSYLFFYFGALFAYPLLMWWFLNLQFMIEDVSRFDKVAYLILFFPMVIYHLFFTKEKKDESLILQKDSEIPA